MRDYNIRIVKAHNGMVLMMQHGGKRVEGAMFDHMWIAKDGAELSEIIMTQLAKHVLTPPKDGIDGLLDDIDGDIQVTLPGKVPVKRAVP